MPREVTTGSATQRRRQQRYRARLQELGRPEASAVDVTLAAAVAVHARDVERDREMDPTALRMILQEALKRLTEDGYSRKQAGDVLRRRVGRYHYARMLSPDSDEEAS